MDDGYYYIMIGRYVLSLVLYMSLQCVVFVDHLRGLYYNRA